MYVNTLAAVNIEIALSNLTGSPEGPGFPGFPLGPCNESKKTIINAPTSETNYRKSNFIFSGN